MNWLRHVSVHFAARSSTLYKSSLHQILEAQEYTKTYKTACKTVSVNDARQRLFAIESPDRSSISILALIVRKSPLTLGPRLSPKN